MYLLSYIHSESLSSTYEMSSSSIACNMKDIDFSIVRRNQHKIYRRIRH